MINRFNGAKAKLAQLAAQPVTWSSVAKSAQHTLTAIGLSALAVLAVLYTRPDVATQLSVLLAPAPVMAIAQAELPDVAAMTMIHAPMAQESSDTAAEPLTAAEEKALKGNKKQQQFVTNWLSKRYRVANDATNMLVATAYVTARDVKIDPLLILAVMAIESGLNPFAESPVGAKGLMQVMSKIHHAKFEQMGGQKAALNPTANIRVGAEILQEYVKRGGSVEAGLKTYVGAAAFETDQGYGSKVLAEYKRLQMVANGKQVPTFTPPSAPAAPAAIVADKPAAPKADTPPAQITGEQLAGLQ
jgi:soluble lytic murein transglycosylase-like protein